MAAAFTTFTTSEFTRERSKRSQGMSSSVQCFMPCHPCCRPPARATFLIFNIVVLRRRLRKRHDGAEEYRNSSRLDLDSPAERQRDSVDRIVERGELGLGGGDAV